MEQRWTVAATAQLPLTSTRADERDRFTFNSGDTTATVTLHVCDDTNDEADETVTVALPPSIAGLQVGTPSSVTVTITDDDEPQDDNNDQDDNDFGWGL